MSSVPVQFLEPHQLAAMLRDPQEAGEFVVVDVRDRDFIGGHIHGAVNIASDQFRDDGKIDDVINGVLQGKGKAVLHCMFSQQRGPRAAMRLAERLGARGLVMPEVYVLTGGFATFARHYQNEKDLVVEFDEAIWRSNH